MKKLCSLIVVGVVFSLILSFPCFANTNKNSLNTGFVPGSIIVTTTSGENVPPFYSGSVIIHLPSGETFETEIYTLKNLKIQKVISDAENNIKVVIDKKFKNNKVSDLMTKLTFVSLLDFIINNPDFKKTNEESLVLNDKINFLINSLSDEIINDLSNKNFEKLQIVLCFIHEFYKFKNTSNLYYSHQKIFCNLKSYILTSNLIHLKNHVDIKGTLRVAEGDIEGSAIGGAIVGAAVGAGVAAAHVIAAPAIVVVAASAAACAAGAAATTAIANAASSLGDWAGSK